jgi:hypothetical protein
VFSVISTDTDSNVITSVGQSTQQNSLTTGFISGSITVYAKASTPIQYSLAYASSGATAMQYELRVVVAGTTAPSSTGTVSSFNGRTGAVTPGSSDYTAAQVGAISNVSTAGGRNFLINGAMEISQRNGTSSLTVNNTLLYTVDRFFLYNAGATAATAQKVTGTNNGTPNSIRISGPLSLGSNFAQRIESNQLNVAAGQTVTLSGLIYGSTSLSSIATYCIVPTAVDNYASTTTVSGSISSLTVNTGTGTTKFSVTFTLPSTAVNGAEVGINFGAALSSGAYVDISELQLEIGSTATAFSRAGGTIQGELAACQRYYWQWSSANQAFTQFCLANAVSTSASRSVVPCPIPMRVVPSSGSVAFSAASTFAPSSGGPSITAITYQSTISTTQQIVIEWAMSTTKYNAMAIEANNTTSAYMNVSAEL